MKVILTEEQLNEVIQEEVNEMNLINALLGFNDPRKIIRKLAIALLVGTISFSTLPRIVDAIGNGNPAVENVDKESFIDKIKNVWEKLKNKEAQITGRMKSDAQGPDFEKKVEALKSYMAIAAKNQNYDPRNILITPEAMVAACYKTGFDLPLLIAQAHLESCFGLTPRARRTNSVFSVGSWDNGKDKATYATQDDSILPYINLMKNNYLKGKTVVDILKPGSFVNGDNKRYASDKDYEKKVASIRNKIISKYPILAS